MSEKKYTPEEAARKVLEKCQQLYNETKVEKAEDMDKCGEMKSEKKDKLKKKMDKAELNPKLKAFLDKRKAKKTAKIEKVMGIGEKAEAAPSAPSAQVSAPVNAPKPLVAEQSSLGIKKA